jgi:hypothetical protein
MFMGLKEAFSRQLSAVSSFLMIAPDYYGRYARGVNCKNKSSPKNPAHAVETRARPFAGAARTSPNKQQSAPRMQIQLSNPISRADDCREVNCQPYANEKHAPANDTDKSANCSILIREFLVDFRSVRIQPIQAKSSDTGLARNTLTMPMVIVLTWNRCQICSVILRLFGKCSTSGLTEIQSILLSAGFLSRTMQAVKLYRQSWKSALQIPS